MNDEAELFECLLAMAAATTTALIFCLLARLNFQLSLMLMGAAAALTGGVLFSLLELRRLGLPVGDRKLMQSRLNNSFDAIGPSSHLAIAEEPQKNLQDRVDGNDPCPHHENYPESPGEDQGQLTSHLPGSTPFFEQLDSWYQIHAARKK